MAQTMSALFSKPLVEKDSRMRIVEMINPEFLITLWNSSVRKKENNNKMTSAKIRIVKNCSKNILLILEKELISCSPDPEI